MSASKRAFEKYEPWGLFSEFYGTLIKPQLLSGTTSIQNRVNSPCRSLSWWRSLQLSRVWAVT